MVWVQVPEQPYEGQVFFVSRKALVLVEVGKLTKEAVAESSLAHETSVKEQPSAPVS